MTLFPLLDPNEGLLPRMSASRFRFPKRASFAVCAALLSVCVLPLRAQEGDAAPAPAPPPAAALDVLPSQALGADDLLQLMVPYCPELSRSFRVSSDGTLALPLLKQRISVAGLQPSQVEQRIAAALVSEQVLADPTVNVSVLEYRSKPVSVVGAVNHPLTFQATGETTLLDAIAKAGGLAPTVGSAITVTHRSQAPDGTTHITVQSIPVRGLLQASDPRLNVKLTGDEEVRVPEAGKIFVAGNVKKPGEFPMQDNTDTTVVKALAMSEGLQAYSTKNAYIYRERGVGAPREEIAVPLSQILARKSPDVVMEADDILYVPENNNKRMTAKVLEGLAGFGSTTAAGMLIYH